MNLPKLKSLKTLTPKRLKARRIDTPAAIEIKPVRKNFTFENVPRYWYDNNPLITHVMNAMSLTFPDGEQFFVDSVRAFREHHTDERQKQHIRGFIGQEAMHSLEHDHFNEFLKTQGYEQQVKGGTKLARFMIKRIQARKSAVDQLATTAALEHITAVLGRWLMTERTLSRLDPSVRALWLWRGIEETEHKAVAFDLLQNVTGGDYLTRVRAMPAAVIELITYAAIYSQEFLKADGLLSRPSVYLRGVRELTRTGGMARMLLPAILEYFDPAFHPWQDDDSKQVAIHKAYLLELEAQAGVQALAA